MYRVVLIIVLVATVWADDEKCKKAHGPAMMHCCMGRPPPPPRHFGPPEEIKECFEIDEKPPSCAREECIADKKGYHAGNGKVDRDALTAIVEKDFKIEEFKEKILKNCIKGDISTYGPPDMCELMKMKHCFHFYIIAEKCPEWSDQGECSGMKELIKECS